MFICKLAIDDSHKPSTIIFSILAVCLWCICSGCASQLHDARKAFYDGNLTQAADLLSKTDTIFSKDRLLYYMENGVILFHLEKYEESIQQFLQAASIIQQQDHISITDQATSLVTTEQIAQYKGEYCEQLWVNTHLMMAFLLLNRFDDALVEAKQALKKIEANPEAFQHDYFTRYLIAYCYDLLNEKNDAYIEYKKLFNELPDANALALDLYRLCQDLGIQDELEQYKKSIQSNGSASSLQGNSSELVVFVSIGKSPVKVSDSIFIPPAHRFSFPKYEDRTVSQLDIRLEVTETSNNYAVISSDLGQLAKTSLEQRAKIIIAKEIARLAAKEAIAKAIENNNNELAANVVRLVFFLLEEPDTRSWETLPAFLTLVRIPLTPGLHDIRLNLVDDFGNIICTYRIPEIELKAGQRKFMSVRMDDSPC
ncbi:MAG: hypothetical protein HQK77_13880 [Desulfobacterales bacterium]|nr:hypothetical protein [Desulfobacterales bacterium]